MKQNLVSIKLWLEQIGRSRVWGWRMRKRGLPTKSINGLVYVVRPAADEWLLNQAGAEHPGIHLKGPANV